MLEGRSTETYGTTAFECEPWSVKFQPAGEWHTDVYGSEPVRCFIVQLRSEWLTRMEATHLLRDSPLVDKGGDLARLMMRLRAQFQSVDEESPLLIEGLALQLIAETSRSLRKRPNGKPPLWLRRAKEVINDQFSHPLTLSLISGFVGVHPVYLASSFRRHYGRSVGEYLRERRIEFACHRIHTSDDSLADIALAAGFANQSHFTRTFKRVTGMTPATYRSARRRA